MLEIRGRDFLILDLISHSDAPRFKFQTGAVIDITPGNMESAAISPTWKTELAAQSQREAGMGHIVAGLGSKAP